MDGDSLYFTIAYEQHYDQPRSNNNGSTTPYTTTTNVVEAAFSYFFIGKTIIKLKFLLLFIQYIITN